MKGCLAVHWTHVEEEMGVKWVHNHFALFPGSSLRVSPVTAGEGGEGKLL